MGASASKATEPDDGDMDDAWMERAWQDGVPFTLLHDDAFVAEKYQELRQNRSDPSSIFDDDALEMTGTDELPMDELERMADAARIKLFTVPRASKHTKEEEGGGGGGRRDGGAQKARRRTAANALTAMEGTALARESRQRITSERRRAQQCEIVRDYMTRLARRLEKRATAAQGRERQWKQGQGQQANKQSTQATNGNPMNSSRGWRRVGASVPGSSLFQVGSFRMQLETLRAFRSVSASLFENGILSLVQTVLEFPAFALHGSPSDEQGSMAAVNELLLHDVERFSREMLALPDLSQTHRGLVLVLLLAFGVCSGRAELLLEFATRVLLPSPSDVHVSRHQLLLSPIGDRTFQELVDELLGQLECYRVQYQLGTLADDCFVKQVNFKMIRDDVIGSTTMSSKESSKQSTSVASDGSYVYSWNITDGLSKIGTGQNFTVAGRVYATVPSQQFLRTLREPRLFYVGFYGMGQDATALVQGFAENGPSIGEPVKTVREVVGVDVADTAAYRLYVRYVRNGQAKSQVLDDQEELRFGSADLEGSSPVDITFAFYGDFVVLSSEALEVIKTASCAETEQDGVSGAVFDSSLLTELLAKSGASDCDVSDDKELILMYSAPTAANDLVLEKFAVGELIAGYEDLGKDVYHSSMVLLDDQIFLSLLHPAGGVEPKTDDVSLHRPRSLLRVSCVDLSLIGDLTLTADGADHRCSALGSQRAARPLFSYTTEGRRLYEIEMSADRFRVRVFNVTKSSPDAVFIRSVDVNIKQIQCATFVSCFLKILKTELRVGDLDFALPSFYTNGSFICMLVPSITSVLTGQENAMASRMLFDCLVFDCETGVIVSSNEGDGSNATSVPAQGEIKSFERSLPGGSCCFDAANNTVWVVNSRRATMCAYRNAGRRVPLDEGDDDESAVKMLQDHQPRDGASTLHSIGARVLAFLAKHSVGDTDESRNANDLSRKSTRSQPFVVGDSADSLCNLLNLAETISERRNSGEASAVDLVCLQCCLRLLRTSFRNVAASPPSSSGDSVSTMAHQPRLQTLLAKLIQQEEKEQSTQTQELNVRVVSAALALSASTMHLGDTSVDSQVDRVVGLVRKWRNQGLSQSDTVVVESLLRQLCKTMESPRIGGASPRDPVDVLGHFASLWNELVGVQVDALRGLSEAADPISSRAASDDLLRQIIGTVNAFVQSSFSRALDSMESLRLARKVFSMVCRGLDKIVTVAAVVIQHNPASKRIQKKVERHIRFGVVRHIAPALFMCAMMLLRHWGDVIDNLSEKNSQGSEKDSERVKPSRAEVQDELASTVISESDGLEPLFKSFHELAAALGTEDKVSSVASVTRTTRNEVMETTHEYENNLDVTNELRIPGATQMTLTFDPQSRTEYNYDYVTFYKDKAQTAFYGEQYYSGRDGEFNWPGVNGLPPLVIDSDHCFVYFHSDASNTDWGFKFTAVGEIFEKATVVQRHWFSALTEMAASVLDEIGKLLVDGTQLVPISENEARNDSILHSDLLRHGVAAESEQSTSAIQLLRDFVLPPEGSDAARVLHAMELKNSHSRLRTKAPAAFGAKSDATSKSPVNTAIRAAMAAILHHNMWGMDAYALAQNLRTDVSEQLLRGWKNAQKMRDWFHLGDAAAEAAHSGSESSSGLSSRQLLLRRQPSAYKGMSDDALQLLSKNVVERAVFLLEMTPMSFSYVAGAKRRWGFLAKYGSALGVGKSLSRSSSDSTLGKWYNLLEELQEATELRSLLHYRRSSSERRKSRRVKSVTEQVLEFIQSDIDVSELRELIQIRNLRAKYRALGFRLYAKMFQANHVSVLLKSTLVESCSSSLRQLALLAAQTVARVTIPSVATAGALPPPRLHFGTLLSGCDGQLRKEVNGAFGVWLAQLSQDLGELLANESAGAGTELIVSTIKAICIDYDIDDMYLLHESSVLPLLLRLLASEASRVRRSAQVLLNVFLSRLVEVGDGGRDEDGNEATLFQKQLFATVGLQLEGVTSQLRDLAATSLRGGDYGSTWRDREQNLARRSSSLTVPVSKDCDLKWNHSILLWMYVSSSLSSYALKVGDVVCRGPSWGEPNETADSKKDSGIVTAISSPTSVRVKWTSSSEETEHAFDPKQGRLEVVLASETIGGVVFCKGTRNFAKDSVLAAPWSHFGMFLNDRRQLSYKISCGAGKECVYETNYELDADEWAHVAIIQNEEVLKFYINGLLVTQHVLDPFLVLRKSFTATESKITESNHPVTESVDQYWPVHIPGASKIRVTFDPLSEIDQTSGFVRFYKNGRCNEIWGEDKYTGRYHDPERNFPGALSNRHRGRRNLVAAAASQGSLEIPSDRFLVHFIHNGESTSWGFRLLATPEFASGASDGGVLEQPSLNAHAFFVGEPPGRVMDGSAAKCWVYQPGVLNVSLGEDEIVEEMQASCPNEQPRDLPLDRALHVIGLLHTCSETVFGQELIATPENVGDLIVIAFEELAPVEVRCACVVVLQELCGSLPTGFLDEQLQRVDPTAVEPFVEFVFSALVKALNVWTHYTDDRQPHTQDEETLDTFDAAEAMPPRPMEFQISATEATALASVYASLIRRLAEDEAWAERISQLIESSLGQRAELSLEKDWASAAGHVTAALSLLGGIYTGVCVGSRVKCCASIDQKETIETGYLLRFQQSHGQRTARILFDCDPVHPVDVPVSDVAYAQDEDDLEIEEFVKAVIPKMAPGLLERLFLPLLTELTVDVPLSSVAYKPKIGRKENVEVLESEHPYAGGEHVTYPLSFRGADEMVIFFDALSSTTGQNDYISFLKRDDDNRRASHPEANNGKPYWGEERYYGENFPGVGAGPPLRIPASSVDVHFHTDATSMGTGVSTSEYGFKLTAHAYEETLTYPPEIPPTFFVNAMNDIRARAMKSLQTCIRALSTCSSPEHVVSSSAFAALMPHLVAIANAPDDGRPTQCSPRTQTFESKHPYANSVRECMAITFNGAARLVITFDPRSQTEHISDYVTFFKDKTLSDRWGAFQYSGTDESANWPGVSDRPPLIIPSDSFTLLWTTDASNVEWGWRFTVSAEYPVITPLALRVDQLHKQAQDLWEIFYEGIGPQRTPFEEEYDGFERISDANDLQSRQQRDDPTRFLLYGTWSDSESSPKQSVHKKFRVIDAKGVDVVVSAEESASVLRRLEVGDELLVVEEHKCWLKTRSSHAGGECEEIGWVKRRSDDQLHVISVRASALNEDVLVLGVDDKQVGHLHSSNASLYLDDSNVEHDVLTKFVSQYSYESLKGQSVRYQSLAYDTHRALAIKHARETLAMVVCSTGKSKMQANVPTTATIPVQVCDFGSPNAMLLFLSHLFSDRDNVVDQVVLEESMIQVLRESSNREHFGSCALVDRCTEILESSEHLLPKGRGAMRMLESRHPYLDDVDQYWQLAVPGAKKILVYFDARSKTETGCDWVCFYKNGSDRSSFFGDPQYSGRGGSENWAGCGGRPPLVIDADNFEVHFHSDANQTDWGFKLFAIGVFDEDEIDASRTTNEKPLVLDEAKLGALVELMRLCLWVLLVAAKSCVASSSSSGDDLRAAIFSTRVVQLLIHSLNDYPQQTRKVALQLLQTMAHDTQFTCSIPSSLIEELRNLLATKIRAQFAVEDRMETKSEYLQMLVECALFVDLAIDSACFPLQQQPREKENGETLLTFAAVGVEGQDRSTEARQYQWTMQPATTDQVGSVLHLQLQLRSISAPLQIILMLDRDATGGMEADVLLHWDSRGKITASPLCSARDTLPPTSTDASLRSGDVISVFVDLQNRVLVLRKNYMCVYSSAVVAMELQANEVIKTIGLRVVATAPNDQVTVRSLSYSPLASLPVAITPNWYNKVCDSVGLLLDFKEQRMASVVECESEHPLSIASMATTPPEPERVCIDGAVALEIRFDRRTILHERHRVAFAGSDGFKTDVVGIRGTKCDDEYPALFFVDPLKRTGILKPEDRVVRASDWCYADEDGGRGSVGVVEAIVPWNARSGCGVRVRWGDAIEASNKEDASCVGVYRYGYDGFFDVQLVQKPKLWDAPLVIPGDTLEFALDCIQEEVAKGKQLLQIGDDSTFQGTLRIDPLKASAIVLDVRKTKLMLGDDCTIEWWLCLESMAEQSQQVLLEIATLDPTHSLFVCVRADGRLCVQARMDGDVMATCANDQSTSALAASVTLAEHQWVHLGIVFSSSKLLLYANGERVLDVSLDQRFLLRSLYISSLNIGGRPPATMSSSPVLEPLRGHVCDMRVWDVALHSEQIHSHANGIDGASPRDSIIGWQSPAASTPQAPRKMSRQSQLPQHLMLPPPSPPRSPRSPSRGMNVPPQQKKWIMANRTGREIATVRANCAISRDCVRCTTSQPLVVYYEAHVLSSGRLCIGWADVGAAPTTRELLLGEYSGAVGIELPRRRALFNGDAIELENPSLSFDGLRSPRRRSSSSSSSTGAGFGDVYAREGDVVGCAFAPATNDFSFYLNGELLAEIRLGGIGAAGNDAEAPSSREQVQGDFESLVGEMLALGFSREASEDALEASAGSEPIRTVQRAIDWLIHESTTSQGDSAAVSSPRRLSTSSPFASPRPRLSSNSIAMAQLRRAVSSDQDATQRAACFVPAATLGAQGAQGIAWNLGHRPFKYTPQFNGTVLSAMQAANCADNDGESIRFEVFDHNEKKWERVTYRHRIQDLVPTLLARWRLDEGCGTTVYDSSGRDQVGAIQIVDLSTTNSVSNSSSGPLSPRSRRSTTSTSCWDANCLPPFAVTRTGESPLLLTGVDSTGSVTSTAASAESAVWGYRFYVIPHFSETTIGRRRFQTQAHRFVMDGPSTKPRHDQQLIKYVNKVSVAKQLSLSQVLRATWSELAPPESELVKWPVLVEIATGVSPSSGEDGDDLTAAMTKALAGSTKAAAIDRLTKRFKLLQELNSAVSRLLPFVAFAPETQPSGGMRLDALIREQRYRVLHAVKRGIWDEALKRTTEKGLTVELTVSRPKAMRHRVSGKVDVEGRFALFSQAFRQLSALGGSHFRQTSAVFHVQFLGENAQDAGGPYRETLAQFADELHSSQLPLLIASSNAQHNVGAAREKWVLNPSATSATQLQMLEFLGKLMGSAMRSQEFLSLQIAQLIWKQLAGDSVSASDDLALVDSMIVSSMEKIRTIDKFGVTPEMFEDIVMETFTTLSTDNRLVPLKPRGASIPVTFDTRIEFADLVEFYRLHEFDDQIAALRRGLSTVVPVRLLSLFTGAELEQMVCGSPEVDVDLLQRCSEYSSCSADDAHIQWFWQVLREFSHDERSVFLRFVWGRSRLPASEKEFPQRFKLQSFNKPVRASTTASSSGERDDVTSLDGYLPIAHTCFFSVELPRYSSLEVLRDKLVYAMYNCQEIDGDGDSVAANQLGWEE